MMAQPYQQSYHASRAARPRPEVEMGALGDPMTDGPILPPCRVCGDKASGFHYGAITCEACKNFFRRSLQRTGEYRCRGSGKCEILLGERRFCSACRLSKCQALGMSKKAIKTGRYTLEKHAENIEEVKRLRMQEEMRRRGAQINASLNAKLQGFRPINDNFSSNPNIRSENLLSPNRSRPSSPGSLSDSAVPYGSVPSPLSSNGSSYNSPCATPSHDQKRSYLLPSYSNPGSPKQPYEFSRRASDQGYMGGGSPQIHVTTVSDEQLVPAYRQGMDSKFTQYQFTYSPHTSTHTTPSHSPVPPEPTEYYNNQSSSGNIYTTTDTILNGDPMLSALPSMESQISYSNGKAYQNIGHYQDPMHNTLDRNMKERISSMTIDDTRYSMQSMISGTNHEANLQFAQDTKYNIAEQPCQGLSSAGNGEPQPMQTNAPFPPHTIKVEQWTEPTHLGQPPPYPYPSNTNPDGQTQGSATACGTMDQATGYSTNMFQTNNMTSMLESRSVENRGIDPMANSYPSYTQYNQSNNPCPLLQQFQPQLKAGLSNETPEFVGSLTSEKIKEMEETIETLTAAYNSAPPFVPEGLEDLHDKERMFMAEKAEKDSLFGPMNPIGPEEYSMIYKTTGIDVDGRREIAKHHMPSIEASIRNYIRIAKYIPGFNDLPVNDRSYLIKRSLYDCWVLSAHRSVNVMESLYTNQQGRTLHRNDMEKVHNRPIVEEFFRQAEYLQGMKMTTTEIILLVIIAMFTGMTPGRLQDPAASKACQNHILECYSYYLHRQGLTGTGRREQLLDFLKNRELNKRASVQPSFIMKEMDQMDLSGMPEYFLEMLKHPEYQ